MDDDPKIVTLVRTYLEREGFAVVTAADGRAALAAVGESQPRLIVLDLMLPELDGLALMRIVRERSEVPIVILSARGSAADKREAAERAHAHHASRCPVHQSIGNCIAMSTELRFI